MSRIFNCFSIIYWAQGTTELCVTCNWEVAEYLVMKVNFENSLAPLPGFEPRIFNAAGLDCNHCAAQFFEEDIIDCGAPKWVTWTSQASTPIPKAIEAITSSWHAVGTCKCSKSQPDPWFCDLCCYDMWQFYNLWKNVVHHKHHPAVCP